MILKTKFIILVLSIISCNLLLSIPETQKGQKESKLPITSTDEPPIISTDEPEVEQEKKEEKSSLIFDPIGRIFFRDRYGILTERFVYRNPNKNELFTSNSAKTYLTKLEAKARKPVLAAAEFVKELTPLRLKVLGLNANALGVKVPAHEQKYVILQNLDNFDIWTFNPFAIHEDIKEDYMKANPTLANNILKKLREKK